MTGEVRPAQHVGIPGRKCLSRPTSGLATTQRWIAAQQGPQPASATLAAPAGLRLMGGLGSSRQGDPDAALADLGRALHAGVPAGYCRLFLDEGPAMARRLQAAARRPDLPGSEQAGALLQAAKRRHTAPSQIFPPAPVG